MHRRPYSVAVLLASVLVALVMVLLGRRANRFAFRGVRGHGPRPRSRPLAAHPSSMVASIPTALPPIDLGPEPASPVAPRAGAATTRWGLPARLLSVLTVLLLVLLVFDEALWITPSDGSSGRIRAATEVADGTISDANPSASPVAGEPSEDPDTTASTTPTAEPGPTATADPGQTATGSSPLPGATSEPTPTATPAPTPTPTPTSAPTATPAPTPTPASGPITGSRGLWRSPSELAALPTSGTGWSYLKQLADAGPGTPVDISCQDSKHNTATMATALVAARLGEPSYRKQVRDAIAAVIGTHHGNTCGHGDDNLALAVGRNLASYVIAADLIGLRSYDPDLDARFRAWIGPLRFSDLGGRTLASGDATDPGNWGAYEGASRAAVALYLGDSTDVARSATALREWLTTGNGFRYNGSWDLSWACDPTRPTPVNPSCSRDGHDLGGIVVADMRRGDGYRWPPVLTNYPRESLVGRTIQAELLARAGYATFSWGDRALLRVAQRLLALDALDGGWYEPRINAYWILDRRHGGLPTAGPSNGRTVLGVDWTHR